MKEKIGKYKILDSENDLQVHYIYGIGDIVSSLFYILGLALGLLFTYIAADRFEIDKLSDYSFWLLTIVGLGLSGFFLFLIVGGLYKPIKGILQVDKNNKSVVIRDLFKNEVVQSEEITSLFCEIITKAKPMQKFGMMYLQTNSGEKKECFIIRSSIPIDLGRKVDKDILDTANVIKNKVYTALNNK